MTKQKFRILSWTWGLPMTLIGYIAAFFLRQFGYKPHKWGGNTFFIVGENWGGLDLGPITLICSDHDDYMLDHEFGHAIQNCYWGFLFPFVIAIPSAVRYWYREIVVRLGIRRRSELPGYYDIWFEKNASNLGQNYIGLWNE